jgi:hypothetical protein
VIRRAFANKCKSTKSGQIPRHATRLDFTPRAGLRHSTQPYLPALRSPLSASPRSSRSIHLTCCDAVHGVRRRVPDRDPIRSADSEAASRYILLLRLLWIYNPRRFGTSPLLPALTSAALMCISSEPCSACRQAMLPQLICAPPWMAEQAVHRLWLCSPAIYEREVQPRSPLSTILPVPIPPASLAQIDHALITNHTFH